MIPKLETLHLLHDAHVPQRRAWLVGVDAATVQVQALQKLGDTGRRLGHLHQLGDRVGALDPEPFVAAIKDHERQ